MSGTQRAALAFFAGVWIVLLAIRVLAPNVYDEALGLPADAGAAGTLFLAALAAFLAVVCAGVVRRWRWVFWLVLLAFLAGPLRIVASALELAGIVPAAAPSWYVTLQGAIGAVELAIGLAMLLGYRRGGIWADP